MILIILYYLPLSIKQIVLNAKYTQILNKRAFYRIRLNNSGFFILAFLNRD